MSEFSRVALPTNQDFGLAEVVLLDDPAKYPVAEPVLPGRSDDELWLDAEQNGRWELCDTHGVHHETLTFTALRNRFREAYDGELVDEPGGFIKAVLALQRTIPTAREYATVLARQGLIRPDEAATLPEVIGDLSPDDDTDAALIRAHYKVQYLANVAVPELRTAELAARYASDRMQAGSKDKAQQRAAEAMYRARGVQDDDLPALMDSTSGALGPREVRYLHSLGVPKDLIEQVGAAPRPRGMFHRFKSASSMLERVLCFGSLDRQVAYRRFFGMQNLVDMATANAVVERPFDDKSLAFSGNAIGMGMAGSLMVHSALGVEDPFKSSFLDGYVASELGITEQTARLGALATFMMREPALNGPQKLIFPCSEILGHHVVDMVTTDYRIWLDQRMLKEQQSN